MLLSKEMLPPLLSLLNIGDWTGRHSFTSSFTVPHILHLGEQLRFLTARSVFLCVDKL